MKRKTLLLRLTGVYLLLLSGVGAFVWFYWLAPLRHLSSNAWMQDHTPKQIWSELQRALKRQTGYSHESGFFLEQWGNKESAAWLIGEFKAGRTYPECSDGYLDMALPFITNQEIGYETNAWIAWWNTNHQKTQEEWIRDGFSKRGIDVARKLTTNNIITLLKIIDRHRTNIITATGTNKITRSLRYNAFRWLRDADVKPNNVNFSTLPDEERNSVIRGLIVYAGDLGTYASHPGRIFKDEDDCSFRTPWILRGYFQWGLAAFLALLAFGGWRLLRSSN